MQLKADALILAGGKNGRMRGTYKGDLRLDSETFADHLIHEMQQVAEQIYLSYGEVDHGEKDGCTIVRDLHPGCGPISGLEAGLTVCRNDYLLVAACDMPFLRADFYRMLLRQAEEKAAKSGELPDCIVPVRQGRADVLAAVYGKKVLPVMQKMIRDGSYRPLRAVEQVNTLYVSLDSMPVYAEMLRNVNTPEEYRELQDVLRTRSPG